MKLSRSDSYYNSPSRTDSGFCRLPCGFVNHAGKSAKISKIPKMLILSGLLIIFLLMFAVAPVSADGDNSTVTEPSPADDDNPTVTEPSPADDDNSTVTEPSPASTEVTSTATTTATATPTSTPTETGTLTMTLTPGKTWSDFLKLDYEAAVSLGYATYKWDFDGDGMSEKQKGTFNFENTGTKKITLTAVSYTKPLKETSINQTVIIAEPKLEPKMSVETVAGTYQIKYEDTTGIPDAYVKSRLWEFGDETSNAKSGTYTYNSSGMKTVKLTITTTGNAKQSASQSVKISGITAKFTASPTSGAAPLEVKFTDNSVRNSKTNSEIDYWKWEFGDGSTVTDKSNPTHTYKNPGEYTVKLTVQDKDYNQDSTEMKITVLDNGDYPTADFGVSSSSSLSGTAPLKVSFVDKSTVSSDTKANITAWYWKITDSSDKLVASFSTQNPSYTFEEGGKYTVALTVTDSKSRTNTKTIENYITVSSGLSATFTASPTSGTAPLNVRFEATPDPDNAYDIDEYAWNFGDGTGVSYGRVISHVYQSAGTYTVKMTVTDEKSKTYTASRSNYITVTAAASSKTVAPTATTTVSSTGTDTALKSKQTSKGDRIFGIPGTQPIRSEMQRMYGFFDDFFTLFFGMFGK